MFFNFRKRPKDPEGPKVTMLMRCSYCTCPGVGVYEWTDGGKDVLCDHDMAFTQTMLMAIDQLVETPRS